jgi:hypothetical protein
LSALTESFQLPEPSFPLLFPYRTDPASESLLLDAQRTMQNSDLLIRFVSIDLSECFAIAAEMNPAFVNNLQSGMQERQFESSLGIEISAYASRSEYSCESSE